MSPKKPAAQTNLESTTLPIVIAASVSVVPAKKQKDTEETLYLMRI